MKTTEACYTEGQRNIDRPVKSGTDECSGLATSDCSMAGQERVVTSRKPQRLAIQKNRGSNGHKNGLDKMRRARDLRSFHGRTERHVQTGRKGDALRVLLHER